MTDYDDAYDYALDFCNPRRENMARPYYSDGTLYATNGHIALAIHDVERPMHEDKGDCLDAIKRTFSMIHDKQKAGQLHSVDVLNMDKALRSVLSRIAEVGRVYSCFNFDLSQGDVRLEKGVRVSALYAQMAMAIIGEACPGANVRVWVEAGGKPVLFGACGAEVVIMPKRGGYPSYAISPCADASTGELVEQNNEEN